MKKLSLILVLLLVFGMTSVFAAEPTFSGVYSNNFSTTDFTDNTTNSGRIRLNVNLPVGDFVNVTMDLRDDAAADGILQFNQVWATTDISGVLGLETVGITLNLGSFEQWMSNWNSATTTNRARFVETPAWSIGGVDGDYSPDMGLDFNVMDLATLLTYFSFDDNDTQYKFGVRLGNVLEGFNLIASYSGGTTWDGTNWIDESYFKADAGYTLGLGNDMTLRIPVNFFTELEAEFTQYSVGVVFDGMGFHAGVGAGSSDIDANGLDVIDVQLSYTIAGATLYINGFTNPAEEVAYDPWGTMVRSGDFLEAIDFGVSYNMGGNMLYLGYVADLDTDQSIMLMMDDSYGRHSVFGGGLYLASYINF